jgi:hypothetical protein
MTMEAAAQPAATTQTVRRIAKPPARKRREPKMSAAKVKATMARLKEENRDRDAARKDPEFPAMLAKVKAEAAAISEAAHRADPGLAGELEAIDRKLRAEMTPEEYEINEYSCAVVREARLEMRAEDAIIAKRRRVAAIKKRSRGAGGR